LSVNEETLTNAAGDTGVRAPTLGERVSHIFGVHAWEPLGGEGSTRVQCTGCKQVQHIGGRPAFDDDLEALLRNDDVAVEDDPPPASRFEPDDDSPYRFGRPTTQTPAYEREEAQSGLLSAWKWIMGLQWWVKIWLLFILLQLVGFIISLFT
jgi:hypothetical protein